MDKSRWPSDHDRSARSHPERPRPTSGRQVLPRAPGLAACDGRASRGVVRRARVRASPRGARELDAERDAPSRLHGSGPTSGSVTTSAGDWRATYRERAHVGRAPACDRAERSRRKRVGALLAAGSGATRALATDRRAAADAFGRAVAGSRAEPRDDRPAARSGARTRSTDDARPRPAVSDGIARDDQEQRDDSRLGSRRECCIAAQAAARRDRPAVPATDEKRQSPRGPPRERSHGRRVGCSYVKLTWL